MILEKRFEYLWNIYKHENKKNPMPPINHERSENVLVRELVPSEEDIVKIMIDFWVRKDLFKTKETTEDLAKSIHKAIIEKMFGKEK